MSNKVRWICGILTVIALATVAWVWDFDYTTAARFFLKE